MQAGFTIPKASSYAITCISDAVVVDVGDHYAALSHSTQAEGENMMIRDTDLVYATAIGYKNEVRSVP